ncbi:hypothetical protein SAMN04487819_108153 [Actinopolyspora alba]|uniref:Uncharacterized protein n=1 Tax=Actinopolyspora alba TaxID=673379 RepID=A0A1I1Y5N0_9ACTN|nr:hypothetical protein [Actinopolyspora alba]SFE14308.1 hypothetical protein SAMN04487819_108153 [Actinopolyspora alba]
MSTPSQSPDPAEQPEQQRAAEESALGAEEEQPTSEAGEGKARKPLVITLTTLGVAVLLGVLGTFALGPLRSNITEAISGFTGPSIEKGDCLDMVDASLQSFEEEKVECGSDASDYKIVKHLTNESCSEKRAYEVLTIESDVYCMVLDVTAGDCLWVQDKQHLDTKVGCKSDKATFNVTKVADKADKTVCAPGSYYAIYPEPARTVCMKEIGGKG